MEVFVKQLGLSAGGRLGQETARGAPHFPTLATELVTGIIIALSFVLCASPLRADALHDGLEEGDRQPPYRGPGHSGSALAPAPDGRVLGMAASKVSLLAWVPLGLFPGQSTNASDLWGYVSPSGREYAILGTNSGAGFVDITDPKQPRIVGFIPSPGSLWKEITTYGEFAYVVADREGEGMQVIDLRSIDQGVVSLASTVTTGGLKTVHTIRINPESGYAYLCGSNLGHGGILPYDLRDPLHPTPGPMVWTEPHDTKDETFVYVHDIVVRSFTSGPLAGREIAYACAGADGFYTIDVTDKAALRRLAHVRYPNLRYCHYGWLSDDAATFFLGDELDEVRQQVNQSTTYQIDVADPAHPFYVRAFSNGNAAIDHNQTGRGRFLLEANYRSGLRVFDCNDLASISEIAYFDTYPDDDFAHFNGLWGVHWMPSGTVIGSDMERGLFVFDLSEATGIAAGGSTIPVGLTLSSNPVRDRAELSFALDRDGPATLQLFDPTGRRVETLIDGNLPRGTHRVEWQPSRSDLPSGVYFAVLETEAGRMIRRLVRVR